MNPNAILTTRQHRICDLLIQGCATKEVADQLNIEEKTADNHIQAIKKRYEVSKVTEVVILFIRRKFSLTFDISEIERRNRVLKFVALIIIGELFSATEFCSYRAKAIRRIRIENARYKRN